MFAKIKLRERIVLGYSFPLLLLMLLNGLAFLNYRNLDVSFQKVEQVKKADKETAQLTSGISKIERSMRGWLIFNDNPETLRVSYQEGLTEYKSAVASIEKISVTPQQKERLTKIRQLGDRVEQFSQEIVKLIESGKKNEALKIFQQGKSRTLVQEVEALQADFEKEQERIVAVLFQDVKQSATIVQIVAGLGTFITVIISLVIAYILASTIVKAIQDASDSVSSSVKDITSTVSKQEQIIFEQSASVSQTTYTMQELGVSALQSAEQAEVSAQRAKQALTLAEGGTKTVGLTVEGIAELRDQVTAIANQIVRLSEQTSQISTVSDLVADLANQTNMLALNAGVEAARAGDQGKGFAVVAGEIRKLADQSKKSAERINALVNEVQAAINSTIMVTDEGTKKATQGIKLVAETGDVFTNIADAVNNVFLNTQQITQTAKQQAVTVQQIVAAINAVNIGAEETAIGITQVKVATEELNEAAQNLQAVL
ncbi:chemotaxis protein [Scytonema sp. UIC 10036]|uniref:methyl-accepting chemotaxis protein n=1 Tax=Scytonema sp. UIC 10036 TaxID=2304196 RepID=UPI0012DA2A84|nr:methyl-accepting chemotaxis protein [Scytonema sp. UIC 10036]MUG98214.1 chemotaxis protein [Scytonema sp. UIC 10036]